MSIGSLSGASLSGISRHSTKMAEKLMKKLDTDASSSISGAELAAFITGSGSTTLSAETIMSGTDTDKSGDLSTAELQSAFERIGQQLKANAEGLPPPPPPKDDKDNDDDVVSSASAKSKYDSAMAFLKALQDNAESASAGSSDSTDGSSNLFAKLLTQLQKGASYSSAGSMSGGMTSSLLNIQA